MKQSHPDDPAPSCHAILFPEGVALSSIASRPAKARQLQTAHFTIVKVLEGAALCSPGYSDQVSQRVLTLHSSKLTRSGLCHPFLAASVPMPVGSADSRQQPEGRQECMSLELLTALSRGCCFVACRVLL